MQFIRKWRMCDDRTFRPSGTGMCGLSCKANKCKDSETRTSVCIPHKKHHQWIMTTLWSTQQATAPLGSDVLTPPGSVRHLWNWRGRTSSTMGVGANVTPFCKCPPEGSDSDPRRCSSLPPPPHRPTQQRKRRTPFTKWLNAISIR